MKYHQVFFPRIVFNFQYVHLETKNTKTKKPVQISLTCDVKSANNHELSTSGIGRSTFDKFTTVT